LTKPPIERRVFCFFLTGAIDAPVA